MNRQRRFQTIEGCTPRDRKVVIEMTGNVPSPDAFATAESWTVAYDNDIYWDACTINDEWYFRGSFQGGYRRFDNQDQVTPICKNLTHR
jgi:hypothetical protein